jgi:hypothetical protein
MFVTPIEVSLLHLGIDNHSTLFVMSVNLKDP